MVWFAVWGGVNFSFARKTKLVTRESEIPAIHAASNTIETMFYSVVKYKVKNPIMAGLPDDDGTTTTLIQLLALFGLKYVGYL